MSSLIISKTVMTWRISVYLSLIAQTNSVICYFSRLRSSTKLQLFNSYCNSFFGCELWDLGDKSLDNMSTAWRKAIRRIWNIPNVTHNYLLPIISNCLPPLDLFCCRFLAFLNSCLTHDSDLVKNLANFSVYYGKSNSPIGRNLLFCARYYGKSQHEFLNCNPKLCVVNSHKQKLTELQTARGLHLQELLLIRDRELQICSRVMPQPLVVILSNTPMPQQGVTGEDEVNPPTRIAYKRPACNLPVIGNDTTNDIRELSPAHALRSTIGHWL